MKKYSFFLFIILIFLLIFFSSGCREVGGKVLDPKNLSGKVIGAMIGYSADYILTDYYKDVDLRRFDTYTDMMLALTFHQLDAAAMEMDEAYVFCRLQPEFMIYGIFAEKEKFAEYLDPGTPELNVKFNEFLAKFRESEEYKDILRRVEECRLIPFEPKKIENSGENGKVIHVSVFDGWEPVSYINTETNEWEGSDVELVTHFANFIGSKVEFSAIGSYTHAVLELSLGKVDIMVCPDSLRLKIDLELAGNVTMSDWIWEKDIVFVVNSTDYKVIEYEAEEE